MKKEKRCDLLIDSTEDARNAEIQPHDSPAAASPSYRLAFTDEEFMLRPELRSVRLQLELLKPQLLQDEQGVESTIAVFGSARLDENSRYYKEARRLSSLITREYQQQGRCKLMVVTGGGPGIMEAANRGAHDEGGKSIGLSIVLPFEQGANRYITPELSFQFHYFAIRKMHFLIRVRAMVGFPGGFGTFDELFETLTLIQTKKIARFPIVLVGKKFWNRIINFPAMVEEGVISEEDLHLITVVDSAVEAFSELQKQIGELDG